MSSAVYGRSISPSDEGHGMPCPYMGDAPPIGGVFTSLAKPYALLYGLFMVAMVALSFDIPAVHDAAMLVRWPVMGALALVGVGIACVRGIGRIPAASIWLFLVIAIAGLSTLWSADGEYSIQRSASLLLLFTATMIGLFSYTRDEANRQAIFDMLWLVAAGLAIGGFLFRMGEMGPGGRYVGLHNRATGAGSYAALLIPFAIYQVRYRLTGVWKFVGWTVVLALLAQVLLSGARMAAATSLLVSLALWFDCYGRRAFVGLLLVMVLAPAPLLLDRRQAGEIEEKGKSYLRVKSISTFTGRWDRWQFGVEKWLERPLLGYGFGISRTLAGQDEPWRFQLEPGEVFNLHSDQIETLMDLGIVGYAPFALFWFTLAIVGLSICFRYRGLARAQGLAMAGATFYAFGDTFMHGGFLAAGGGVAAFSWSAIAILLAIKQSAVPQSTADDQTEWEHVPMEAPQTRTLHPPVRAKRDPQRLPSAQRVLAGAPQG